MRQLSKDLPPGCAEPKQLAINGILCGKGELWRWGCSKDPSGQMWEESPCFRLCSSYSPHIHLHTLLTPTQPPESCS